MIDPVWAVVPAAGVGARMGSAVPKQYHLLGDRAVIVHTLTRLGSCTQIAGIVVAIAGGDRYWPRVESQLTRQVRVAAGGAERSESVLNALEVVSRITPRPRWVLVHDAVRPCLVAEDLDRLISAAIECRDGALLASPVRDTMKEVADGRVVRTVSREALWHALTPQMFDLDRLRGALQQARREGYAVTDEAQAMERAGHRPRVVHGRADNIKITRAEDLTLASFFLERQRAS